MAANSRIFKGPGPIQIPRLTADPASGVNGEIYYNTTSNVFKQHVNGAWQIVVDENSIAAVAANKTLSNLTSPVALNQDVLGSADDTRSLGSVSNRFANGFFTISTINSLRVKDSGSAFYSQFAAPSMSASVTYTLPAADGTSGQVLQTNGSGVLSWASAGGGGANQALSNLASVAINTALKFADNVSGDVSTNDRTNVSSDPLSLYTGNVTVNDTLAESTGDVVVASGTLTTNAGAGQSGNVTIQTGTSDLSSGAIGIYSGPTTGASSGTGSVTIESGAVTDGTSGGMIFRSGSVAGTGTSGTVTLETGSGGAGGGGSGVLSLITGPATASSASGNIAINTGNVVDGQVGSVQIATGAVTGTGTQGTVSISTNANQSTLTNNPNGYLQIISAMLWSNETDTAFMFRPGEKTLAGSTGTATTITGMQWADQSFSSAEIKYTMIEKSTGKVRKGVLYVVQDMNTAADVSYTDDVHVENASFANVVLSAVSSGGNVLVQFTNASANDVYFKPQVYFEAPNYGAL
jgi:hypothetical protein